MHGDALRVGSMINEYKSLQNALELFDKDSGDSAEWDAVAAPLRQRLADLARGLTRASAMTESELALKAGVALTWIDQTRSDIPSLLSASLCRDVILMFPSEV